MNALPIVQNVFWHFFALQKKINVSFFNYLLTRNLNDTSINMNMIYDNLITRIRWKSKIWRSITTERITILTTQVPFLNQMDVIKCLILEFKFLNKMTTKNLHFWNNFFYCSILQLRRTFAGSSNCSLLFIIHSSVLSWKKQKLKKDRKRDNFIPAFSLLCFLQISN